jgi:basic membrane lipoprotein Med (substrate-binding protein (PBP1-ABC) superfamily)
MVMLRPDARATYHVAIVHQPAEKGPMRVRRTARAFSLAILVALVSGASATAQLDDGPVATQPPPEVPGVKTAVLRSELTDPAVDSIIEEAARFAQREIGGRVDGRGQPYRSELLPSRAEVVLRARNLAAESDEADDPVNLMLLSGGDSGVTSAFANSFPGTTFIDVDQPVPCLTAEGQRDPTGLCEGGLEIIPGNLVTMTFDVDQAAYLAGILAASASRNDRLGIISGTAACPSCNRAIHGFVRGAQSVQPDIDVKIAYLADDEHYRAEGGEAAAFGDQAAARTFAHAFIDVYKPDVILPLAGSASRGIIEAVCETADTLAVGADFDVAAAYPGLADCILASIVKDYGYAVREAVFAYARDDLTPDWRLGLDGDHVAITDEWTRRPGLPGGLQDRITRAEEGILTNQIETCPDGCELPIDPSALPAGPTGGETSPGPDGSAEPATS